MSFYTIQQYKGVLGGVQLSVTTTPQQVFDGLTTLRTISDFDQGVFLTNCDAVASVYLWWDNTASSTNFFKKLAPGEFFEILCSRGVQGALFAVASAGTAKLNLSVLQ